MSTLSTAELGQWVRVLPSLAADVDDAELVSQLTLLEGLKSACAAVQARVTAQFAASRHADGAQRNQDKDRIERSIAAQVAMARKESPVAGRHHLTLARALTGSLPNTLAALHAGQISEWRATLVARATSHLTSDERHIVDAELAPQLPTLGDRRTHDVATAISYRLDPAGALARNRKAVTDRHVSLRPAPDCMAYLTALLPMTQGVAVYAALHRDALAINLADGNRTRAHIMADELVRRATVNAVDGCNDDGIPDRIGGGLHVEVVMTDRTLVGGDSEPAELVGYGPIPAHLARQLAYAGSPETCRWLRRLYTRPGTGELAAMEAKSRLFPDAIRHFLLLRDRTCRTPWCNAPIRHADHIQPHHGGGVTDADNGQGLCENCNQTKETGGWQYQRHPDGRIEVSTPLRIIYQSPPRPAPGSIFRV